MNPELKSLTLDFIEKHSTIVLGSILMASISDIFDTLVVPKLLTNVINSVGTDKLKDNILNFVTAIAIGKILYTGSIYLSNQIEPSIHNHILKELTKAVIRKYQESGEPIQVAVVMEKVNIISKALDSTIRYICFRFIPLFITLMVTLISIFRVNTKLGICVFICMVIFGLILYNMAYPLNIDKMKESVLDKIEDAFNNMEFVISSQNGVQLIEKEILSKSDGYHVSKVDYTKKHSITQGFGYSTGAVFYFISIYYMYQLYIRKEIDNKNFTAYLLILGKFYGVIFRIAEYVPSIVKVHNTMNSTTKFLNSVYKKYPFKHDIPLEDGSISFKDVSFKYEDGPRILSQFNMSYPSGSKICVYGDSGSGKSTFTNLIKGSIYPTRGDVYAGKIITSNTSKQELQISIACVIQNASSLLQRSIYKNIIFGLDDSKDLRERVEKVFIDYDLARVFNCNPDEPSTNPLKFLDDNVCKLSGGQYQVVHCIHAIFQPLTKILILDEPTSALDVGTRDNILSLVRSKKDVTVIHITHDTSVRDLYTNVITFNKGSNPTIT
jgi:ABC-type multidrug transport system fused ATPase/permease subunit